MRAGAADEVVAAGARVRDGAGVLTAVVDDAAVRARCACCCVLEKRQGKKDKDSRQ